MPELGRAKRVERPVTKELGIDDEAHPGEDIELDAFDTDDTGGRPHPIGVAMETAQVDISRDRRVTLTSPIPAQLAEAMLSGATAGGGGSARAPGPVGGGAARLPGPGGMRAARDPAAPHAQEGYPTRRMGDDDEHHTRRVGDSDRQSLGAGSKPTASAEAGIAPCRQRAAALIDEARRALDEGDLTAAVTAAEGALHEADEAPPPGIVEVIEPARPLLARVFAAYVGPLGGVPVLAPRAEEIARARLGERERAIIGRIDGSRTLEELFDGSGVGSTDVLRIAARLIRAGAVRVI
jgi:hypothetical protein